MGTISSARVSTRPLMTSKPCRFPQVRGSSSAEEREGGGRIERQPCVCVRVCSYVCVCACVRVSLCHSVSYSCAHCLSASLLIDLDVLQHGRTPSRAITSCPSSLSSTSTSTLHFPVRCKRVVLCCCGCCCLRKTLHTNTLTPRKFLMRCCLWCFLGSPPPPFLSLFTTTTTTTTSLPHRPRTQLPRAARVCSSHHLHGIRRGCAPAHMWW